MGRVGAHFGSDLAEALHDGIHRFIQRGGAGSDADVARLAKPSGIQFSSLFDLDRGKALSSGFLCELARVVAVATTDDDDVVAISQQIIHGRLPLLGGMADGVDETHFRTAVAAFDGIHHSQRDFDRLRGL